MTRSAILVAGLSLSAGLPSAMPAAADSRVGVHIVAGSPQPRYGQPSYGYGNGYGYGYGRGAYRFGYSRGYEDGFDHGKDDAEDRDSFNLWHDKDYRKGDRGYREHYGSRWDYQRGYRGGYEVAYRRAYGHFQRRHDHDRCDARYWTRELPRYDDRYRDDRDRYDDRYRYEDGRDSRDPYDPYQR
jgi:hypothetical protein